MIKRGPRLKDLVTIHPVTQEYYMDLTDYILNELENSNLYDYVEENTINDINFELTNNYSDEFELHYRIGLIEGALRMASMTQEGLKY